MADAFSPGPGRLRRAARTVAEALLDMVYPRSCAVCGRQLDDPEYPHLCGECLLKVRWIAGEACVRCALPLGPYADNHGGRWCPSCKNLRLAFQRAAAAAVYEDPVKALILGLKYGRRMHLAATLGQIITRRAASRLEGSDHDVVVPVPLHSRRRRERGFDQAELLAERLATSAGLPLARALERTRYTGAQAALSRTARFENLKGAFAARRPEAVRAKRVLLVDDVMTTGATASAAARALRDAGAREVTAIVVARALRG